VDLCIPYAVAAIVAVAAGLSKPRSILWPGSLRWQAMSGLQVKTEYSTKPPTAESRISLSLD